MHKHSKIMQAGTLAATDVAGLLGISTATLYRYVAPDGTVRTMP